MRLSPHQENEILDLLAQQVSVREICRRYHCHHDTVDRLRHQTRPATLVRHRNRAVSSQIGANIARERQRHNLSVQQLAERARIAESYITEIERRPSRPAAETIFQIARALGVSMESLLGQAGNAEVCISEALWIMGRQYDLPYEEIVMLSRLRHDGRQPCTPNGWWEVYQIFLRVLEYDL